MPFGQQNTLKLVGLHVWQYLRHKNQVSWQEEITHRYRKRVFTKTEMRPLTAEFFQPPKTNIVSSTTIFSGWDIGLHAKAELLNLKCLNLILQRSTEVLRFVLCVLKMQWKRISYSSLPGLWWSFVLNQYLSAGQTSKWLPGVFSLKDI